MGDIVSLNIDTHVAEVVLDRADKLNALNIDMFTEISEVANVIAAEESIRAVILRGAGGNFCAGIDLSVLTDPGLDVPAVLLAPAESSPANLAQRAAYAWRELPMPVICSIDGVAFGGGLQVALGADVRFAAPDAQFSIMESKWGIIPDMGISTTLRNLVPPDRVKELSWSARVFDSKEALSLGLVTDVVDDPLAAARNLAGECAARSPDAVRGIKQLVNRAWTLGEAESLALEEKIQRGIIGGANQREAVDANLNRRNPDFQDPTTS